MSQPKWKLGGKSKNTLREMLREMVLQIEIETLPIYTKSLKKKKSGRSTPMAILLKTGMNSKILPLVGA